MNAPPIAILGHHQTSVARMIAQQGLTTHYERRDLKIVGTGGAEREVSFTVPNHWSDGAAETLAGKYARRAGVPSKTQDRPGFDHLPKRLRPQDAAPDATFGAETDARQVFHRLCSQWAFEAHQQGLSTPQEAEALYSEWYLCLEWQIAAPNSPQWFNTGLAHAYGLRGEPSGFWRFDGHDNSAAPDSYSWPNISACYILSVEDKLTGDGGIMDLWHREASLFRFGSGAGSNVTTLRAKGERLSGGGKSSGMMSWLKIGDRAAGAVESGGVTRRAALMRCGDVTHPEIEDFAVWKAREEQKVAALVMGSHLLHDLAERIEDAVRSHGIGSPQTRAAVADARAAKMPEGTIYQIAVLAEQARLDGHGERQDGQSPRALSIPRFNADWQSEAYETVSGQNSNNTIRVTDDFMRAMERDEAWDLRGVVDASVNRTIPAREVWDKIVMAAWQSADPGLHFTDTINQWHTAPEEGPIDASNPCSEYLHNNDTACNLASINVARFIPDRGSDSFVGLSSPEVGYDFAGLAYVAALWTILLEVSAGMASYPTATIARKSHAHRTLGLGMTNLGGLLMRQGIPYGSQQGTAWGGVLAAVINASAYHQSAIMAQRLGACEVWARNAPHATTVLARHLALLYRRACVTDTNGSLGRHMWQRMTGVDTSVLLPLEERACLAPREPLWCQGERADILHGAEVALSWYAQALEQAKFHGLRNMQLTVQAPTGTISFVLDADTTGIEPDYALVKHKNFAGHGWRKIVNEAALEALRALGWNPDDALAACDKILTTGYFDPLDPFPKGYHPRGHHNYNSAADVLRCAAQPKDALTPEQHLAMMATIQEHTSGAISKTVNLPRTATLGDVARAYARAYRLGIKAIALYRDGSKLSQPLSAAAKQAPAPYDLPALDVPTQGDIPKPPQAHTASPAQAPASSPAQAPVSSPAQALRVKLPSLRHGALALKVKLAGHTFYLHTGEYADGRLGEVFVDMGKQGGDLGGWVSAWAQTLSIALQHGTPLGAFLSTYEHHRAEPSGMVLWDDAPPAPLAHIRFARSPQDLICAILRAFYDDQGKRRSADAPALALPLSLPSDPAALAHQAPPVEPAPSSASAKGGDLCPNCNSFALKWSGKCQVCDVCHTTTGCS